MQHRDDAQTLLATLARDDLAATAAVRPTVVGSAGRRPLLLVRCRPFDHGGFAAVLTEVLRLLTALGCDRVALSCGGRAWVCADGVADDGRHTAAHDDASDVVVIAHAERDGTRVAMDWRMWAVGRGSTGGAPPPWVPLVDAGAGAVGAVVHVLERTLAAPAQPPDLEAFITHARECITLGHLLHVPDDRGAGSDRPVTDVRPPPDHASDDARGV